MEIAERIKQVVNLSGFSPYTFEKQAGISTNTIKGVLDGRNKPGYDTLVKIVSKFPEINPVWLLMGEGEMLKSNKPEDALPPNPSNATIIGRIGPSTEPDFVMPYYKTNDPPIPEPDVVSDHPDTKPQNIWKPGDPLPKRPPKSLLKNTSENKPTPIFSGLNLEHTYAQVPILYNGFASAGLGHAQEGISIKGLPTAPIPGLKKSGTYVAIRAKGNSMQPTLADGTWIILSPWHERYFNPNNLFVIFNLEQDEAYVKRLRYNPHKPYLTLVSDNPTFAPEDLPLDKVGQIWKVELALNSIFPEPEQGPTGAQIANLQVQIDAINKRLP